MPSPPRSITRRDALKGGAAAVGGAVASGILPGVAPAFVRDRPQLTHGVQSGDPTARTAVVRARGDRPSRMLVEVSRDPGFKRRRTVLGPVLTPDTDLTAKVRLRQLPAGEELHYRVRLEDLRDPTVTSRPVDGRLRTAPRLLGDVSFVWSGDLAGQNFGINPDVGGFRIFDAMRRLRPDFFVCSGDTVYADGPLTETVALPDGRTWRNVVTPAKAKVAESLEEFRGQYAYNLLDEALRRFNAVVPQINQWDDHEVTNNWYPGETLTDDGPDARYTEKSVDVLTARARQAFFEWLPIGPQRAEAGRIYRRIGYGPLLDLFVLDCRTYKDPNGENRYADPRRGLLGAAQRDWLEQELAASQATWKVLATDLPLGLVVPDGPGAQEGIAQGDPGAPLGRELEFADVLRSAYDADVTGIVLITADVHYTAAHHYDADRGAVDEFAPFWEFVSGPLNAGGFGPAPLDGTFGPEARFVAAPPRVAASPLEVAQYFGHVRIDGESRVMTVDLRDTDGRSLFAVDLQPDDLLARHRIHAR